MQASAFTDVLDAVYEGIIDPSSWTRALELLSSSFGAEGVVLYVMDSECQLRNGIVSWPYTADGLGEYAREYQSFDQRFPRLLASRRFNRVTRTRDLMTKGEVESCPVHQEFYRRYDLWRMLVNVTPLDEGGWVVLAGHRPRTYGEFDEHEARVFENLFFHVASAVRVGNRLGNAMLRSSAAEAVVDKLTTGLGFLDAAGRLYYANEVLEEILGAGDGLSTRQQRLVCVDPTDDAELQGQVLRALTAPGTAHSASAHRLSVRRRDGKRPYGVNVVRVAGNDGVLGVHKATALVLVQDPERRVETPTAVLQRLFGLTRAQANVTRLLACGWSAEQVAEALNITVRTARVHIGEIYRKCQVTRQSQLVRLVDAITPTK